MTAVGVLPANECMHATYARDFSIEMRSVSGGLNCAHLEQRVEGYRNISCVCCGVHCGHMLWSHLFCCESNNKIGLWLFMVLCPVWFTLTITRPHIFYLYKSSFLKHSSHVIFYLGKVQRGVSSSEEALGIGHWLPHGPFWNYETQLAHCTLHSWHICNVTVHVEFMTEHIHTISNTQYG